MKIIFISVISFLLSIFVNPNYLYAQEEIIISRSERIEELTKKLQLKLLLDNEQSELIDSVLIKNLPNTILEQNRDSTFNSVNRIIEGILTDRQRIKFEIIKSNWLEELVGTNE
jgi:hypothetical protein